MRSSGDCDLLIKQQRQIHVGVEYVVRRPVIDRVEIEPQLEASRPQLRLGSSKSIVPL